MGLFSVYTEIGFRHILDERLLTNITSAEGYDHVLFIIALAAVYRWDEIKKVAILVTAFTIGHSLTLAFSALGVIRVPTSLVEFLIPLTILLTVLYNLVTHKNSVTKRALTYRYMVALLFGLIHGLGFSNYLNALLGQEESIVVPLLGFNLGLELGQLLVVSILLFFHFILDKIIKIKRKSYVLLLSIFVLFFTLPILISAFRAFIN